jgi:predicted GNAT family N-acyltransferase
MVIGDYEQLKLRHRGQLKSFECTDKDLNDFLFNDAIDYYDQLMGVTYVWVDKTKDTIVAYYTLVNDKITRDEDERSSWNRLSRPSMKIGRLAVNSQYERQGVGQYILNYLKLRLISDKRVSGCRFITVDAYRAALPFYERCGFAFLSHKDESDPTRLMFFDLKRVLP